MAYIIAVLLSTLRFIRLLIPLILFAIFILFYSLQPNFQDSLQANGLPMLLGDTGVRIAIALVVAFYLVLLLNRNSIRFWTWLQLLGRVTFVRNIHLAILQNRIAPDVVPGNPALRLLFRSNRLIRRYRFRATVIFIILGSAIGIPAFQYWLEFRWVNYQDKNPETIGGYLSYVYNQLQNIDAVPEVANIRLIDLAVLGVLTAIIVLIFWLSFLYYINRPRHIITGFTTPDSDPFLQAASIKLTDALTKNLKEIGKLLSLRLSENVITGLDDPLPLFVTSGQDEELVAQLSSLSDFEASNVKIPLAGLLSLFVYNLAQTRVRGTLNREKDGYVGVWVELFSRDLGGTIQIGSERLRPTASGYIDEKQVAETAYALAVELTFEFGKVKKLASTPESLRLFLSGLKASQERNWWYAIDCYREATQIEQAIRGSFGTGYYHIGATLLSQGFPDEALENLIAAEASSPPPPMAETYYALALAKVSLTAIHLHKDANNKDVTIRDVEGHLVESPPLKQILIWLEKSLKLRPDFAVAYHLRGNIFYQHAKLMERSASPSGTNNNNPGPALTASLDSYKKSINDIRKAIIFYRRYLPNRHIRTTWQESKDGYAAEFLALHHLADSLRSYAAICRHQESYQFPGAWTTCYRLALRLYEEAEIGIAGHLRNSIDYVMTRTLLAESGDTSQWMETYNYLREEIYARPEARLNPDINLYRAWIASGIAADISQHSLDTRVNYRREALYRLDFAITMRPRFAEPRLQTNWFQTWTKGLNQSYFQLMPKSEQAHTTDSSENNTPNGFPEPKGIEITASSHGIQLLLLREWLRLRISNSTALTAPGSEKASIVSMCSYNLLEPLPLYGETVSISIHGSQENFNLDQIGNYHIYYMNWCRQFAELLYDRDRNRKAQDKDTRILNQLGDKVHNGWSRLDSELKSGKYDKINFQNRLLWQLYSELAVLDCKIQSEIALQSIDPNYSTLVAIATESSNKLIDMNSSLTDKSDGSGWFDKWRAHYTKNGSKDFKFSHLVIRYNYASLLAYRAIGEISEGTKSKAYVSKLISIIEEKLQDLTIEYHPLFLYVRALVFRMNGQFQQAIFDLMLLLKIAETFEPKTSDLFGGIPDITQDKEALEGRKLTFDGHNSRRRLYYLERVSGQQQFEQFIDKAKLYQELAEIHSKQGDHYSSTQYLMKALTWSSYDDQDTENFWLLAQHFYRLDRFQEALAVAKEAQRRLSPSNISKEKQGIYGLRFNVFRCILLTRLGDYQQSLETGENLIESKVDRKIKILHKILQKSISKPGTKKPMPTRKEDKGYEMNKYGTELLEWTKGRIESSCLITKLATSINQQLSQRLEDLFQIADLYNNIAYNRAKLGVELFEAMEYVAISIAIGDAIKNKVKDLAHIAKEIKASERLALYYDTLAWAYYRMRHQSADVRSSLQFAQDCLLNHALKHDSGLAIAHYHLARVYVALAEHQWRVIQFDSKKEKDRALQIPSWLSSASHHAKTATSRDPHGRLSSELRTLGDVIYRYQEYSQRLSTPDQLFEDDNPTNRITNVLGNVHVSP